MYANTKRSLGQNKNIISSQIARFFLELLILTFYLIIVLYGPFERNKKNFVYRFVNILLQLTFF